MKKLSSIFLGLALGTMLSTQVANAACNYPTYSHGSRHLTSFALTDGTNNVSVPVNQGTTAGASIYFDRTEYALTTFPGVSLSFSDLVWFESWMHGYLFVDYDGDGEYNSTLNANGTTGGELVSYSFYDEYKRDSGKNSIGVTVGNGVALNKGTMPAFTLPADLPAGDYKALFKVDWCNIDPCGDVQMGTNGGAAVEFIIKVEAPAERTITIKSNDESKGTVAIEGAAGLSITTADAVTVTATPVFGYSFDYWMNDADNSNYSTANPFTIHNKEDLSLTAVFVDLKYPTMKRTYTNGANQGNRYLASVTTTGTFTPTVFTCATEEELPYTAFTATPGTYVEEGATIDKTANHIVVEEGTTSFRLTYHGYNKNIGTYEPQMDWVQEACFVDWNCDGNFTGNEIYSKGWSSMPYNAILSADGASRTISIPAGQAPGLYRLRVAFLEPSSTYTYWQNTLFTSGNCELRNGVSYDMIIEIKAPVETYSVNYTATGEGTLSVTSNGEAVENGASVENGTELVITATPEKYYRVSSLTVNGADFENGGTYTVEGEDVTIAAEFEEIPTYHVSLSVEGNGKLEYSYAGELYDIEGDFDEGSVLTITATPDEGYELSTLTVNGAAFENGGEYTLMGDIDLAATFTKAAEVDPTPTPDFTFRRYSSDGSSRYLNYIGYTVNGETKEVYSVDDPRTEDYYVAPYNGQWQTEGAYIDFTDKVIEVPANAENFTITLKSNPNAASSKWSQNAVFVDWNKNGVYNEDGETNGVINIGKKPNEAGGALVITAAGDNDVITLPAGLEAGKYSLLIAMTEPKGLTGTEDLWGTNWDWTKEIFADGVCTLINGQAYALTVEVTAAAEEPTVNVTIEQPKGEGNIIKVTGADGREITDTANLHETLTVTAELTDNSNFYGFVFTAADDPENVAYMFDNPATYTVEGDIIISAEVEVLYALNYEATEGGNLTVTVGNAGMVYPTGSKIEDGSEITITATPDEGYELVSLTVNGEEIENGSTYTMDGADVNIVATFGVPVADVDDSVLIPAGTSSKPYTFRFDDAPLGDHVNGSNSETTDFRSRNFTYAAWVNVKSLGSGNVVLGNIQKGFSQACGAFLVKLNNGKLALNGRNATAISSFEDLNGTETTDAGTTLNEWVFIAVVADQDAHTVTLYKNCQPISSYETTYGVGLLADESVFFIGDGGTSAAFSEVQLWTKALTAEELKAAYVGRYTNAPEGLAAYYRAGYMDNGSTTDLRNLGTAGSTVGQVITGNYQLIGGWNPQFSSQAATELQLTGEARQNPTVNVTIEQPSGEGNVIKVTGAEGREITDSADLFEELTVTVEYTESSELNAIMVADSNDNVTTYTENPATFTVEGDVTISADITTWYSVNYESTAGGTLTVLINGMEYDSGTEVQDGAVVSISATPDEGYLLTSLTVNGEDIENDATYTVNGSDVNISAVFEAEPKDLTDAILIPSCTSSNPISFRFDDAPLGDHVNGNNNEDTDHRSRNFTYAAWINVKALGADHVVMGNIQKDFSQACGAFLVKLKDGKLCLNGRDATTISRFENINGSESADEGTALNEWAFVAVVADQESHSVTLYKNCMAISSFTTTYGIGLLPDQSEFFIGDAGTSVAFANVQLWTKALNEEELMDAFQSYYPTAPEELVAFYQAPTTDEAVTSLANLGSEGTTSAYVYSGEYKVQGWSPMFANRVATEIVFADENVAYPTVDVTIEHPAGTTLKVTANDGREITDKARQFEQLTVSATEGTIKSVQVTDESGSVWSYGADEPIRAYGPMTISATMAADKYTVKGTVEHGRLIIADETYDVYEQIPEDGIEVPSGKKYFIVASPESASYELKSFIVNGKDVKADVVYNSYTVESLDEDLTVKVVFEYPSFRVSGEVENGDEGGYSFEIRDNTNLPLELDAQGGVSVLKGTSVYFVIVSPTNTDPSVQYSFTLTDNDEQVTNIYPFSDNKLYIINNVEKDHHLVIKQDKTVGVFGITDDNDNALSFVNGKLVAASENASIEVYDVAGRVVARAQGGEVALEGLVKGVYIARATVDGKNYTLKFSKN